MVSTSVNRKYLLGVENLFRLVPVVLLAGVSVCAVHRTAFLYDPNSLYWQRGMTIAPRIEVYTQIACDEIHPYVPPPSTNSTTSLLLPVTLRDFQITPPPMLDSSIPITEIHTTYLMHTNSRASGEKEFRVAAPSQECLRDPAVQSRAAGIQASV